MYQVDIELVGLLIENNLCHIFKNNDETPIKIGDKTFLSKELNFPLRLATVDNENILNYLEKNITKSFPDLEPFMLIKELTKNIKYNTLDVMIRNNNHKFIECLLKNYDQSYIFKELDTKNVFEIVIKNSYIFHLVSKNNELVNKFVNNYNPNFLFEPIGKSHRDLHFRLYKYIHQKKELDYILYISYIFEHDLYGQALNKSHYINVVEQYNLKFKPKNEESLLCRILLKLFGTSEKFIHLFTIPKFSWIKKMIDFLMSNFEYYYSYEFNMTILTMVLLSIFNKHSIPIVKYIHDKINSKKYYDIYFMGKRFIINNYNPRLVYTLINYNVYDEIFSNKNLYLIPEVLSKIILYRGFEYIKNENKYSSKNSYLMEDNNFIEYMDKYNIDEKVLFTKTNIEGFKLDIISIAILTNDILLIMYLTHCYNKNFRFKNDEYDDYKCCDCLRCSDESIACLTSRLISDIHMGDEFIEYKKYNLSSFMIYDYKIFAGISEKSCYCCYEMLDVIDEITYKENQTLVEYINLNISNIEKLIEYI
jgi:hypothetical protein